MRASAKFAFEARRPKSPFTATIRNFGLYRTGAWRGHDIPEFATHDLRRTYAQIGYDAGVPITQISILLGHANVTTTQRYLNLELDLSVTASDFVPV